MSRLCCLLLLCLLPLAAPAALQLDEPGCASPRLLRSAFNDECGALAAAVYGFDFQRARALLRQAAQQQGIVLKGNG